MMHRTFLSSLALLLLWLSWPAPAVAVVSRQQALLNAKNLEVVTTGGATYYFLVTTNDYQRMTFSDGNVEIDGTVIPFSDIKSISYRTLSRVILDEDSTTYNRANVVNFGLLGLRRTMVVGQWNSLVLPVSLTTEQIIDAFGEGTQVAKPRGLKEDDATVVELTTIDMEPHATVINANYHYLVRPTREPDVTADKFIINFLPGTSRLYGPVYLIPQVVLAKNPFVRAQSFYASDTQYKAVFRGTYTKLDDSVVKGTTISNKRIEAGTYMLNDEGLYVQNTEPAEVKAFSSWVEAITPEDKPLTFYLDGESLNPTAIADLHIAQPAETTTDDGIYDLGGRRVGTMPADRSRLKPGMYVIQGRKVIIK